MSVDNLRSLAQIAPRLYRERKEPKKSGGVRLIEAPHANLKNVQRLLLHVVLESLPLKNCFFGKPGTSAIQAAQLHVNKSVVITMDIKDFFPSVSSKHVHGMFRRRGATQAIGRMLTRILTRGAHLPQGAPTSSYVAALVLSPTMDHILAALKPVKGSSMSVYVDDAAVSGPVGLCRMVKTIAGIFGRHGFTVHPGKIRVMSRNVEQEVLGLVVNNGLATSKTFGKKYEHAVREFGPSHPTVKGMKAFSVAVARASATA